MGNEIITCAVVGATGRMGRRICEIISAAENYRLAGATERTGHPQIGKMLQEVLGTVKSEVRLSGGLEDIATAFDVIIDFTFPAVSLQTVKFARRDKKPAVIGSTGFYAEEMGEIRTLSADFPCVCAPNMSMGVNLLFSLVRQVAQILGDSFDAEVLEAHHRNKKDAPSGTAVRIAQILADAYGRDLSRVGVCLLFLLLGITVMDAAATDVVILICQEATWIVPVTRVGIVACSKSSGISRACPTSIDANCAQVLANYLSDGLVIKNVKPWRDIGLIYTLIK